ncbi:MAG TPA: methyltransferase [Planctomycetota bacterium]|nr:methyltransferase [Planctomycetota bacterium]
MSAQNSANHPSPVLFFETLNAYQRTAALKAGIELEVFTAIAEGKQSVADLCTRCGAHEHGIRILCDTLTIIGFLTKSGERYALSADSAAFLDKRQPTYMGGAAEFLLAPMLIDGFKDFTNAVRKGGTTVQQNAVSPENPVWVKFARAMVPLMMLPAELMAKLVLNGSQEKMRILDIATGHGIFGLQFAKLNPNAEIVAQDWPNVLEVAKENAQKYGASSRFSTLPGSAFDVDFGSGYDLILLTNFLHHFDAPSCEKLLKKVHAALKPGGRAVTLEFIPKEDRVTPPGSAAFAIIMLGTTPAGDAYTYSELERMHKNAGFARTELHHLQPTMQSTVIAWK